MTEQELDKRIGIAELRGEMTQMNKRIDDVNKRIDDLRADIQDVRATLRWVIGIQITMFFVQFSSDFTARFRAKSGQPKQ